MGIEQHRSFPKFFMLALIAELRERTKTLEKNIHNNIRYLHRRLERALFS